jgi:hypothetical protein
VVSRDCLQGLHKRYGATRLTALRYHGPPGKEFRIRPSLARFVEVGSGWDFARTNSAGTTTDHATGRKSAEGNHELFIVRQEQDGAWKIARYSFSPTNPPQH